MLATIPNIELVKALRIYGPYVDDDQNNTSLLHGIDLPPTEKLRPILKTRTMTDTTFNPVAMAIDGIYQELKLVKGNTGVIFISDFLDPKDEMATSAYMVKRYYHDRVSFYPVVIGNDGPGRNSAEAITAGVGSGITAMASSLESGAALADFMEKVIFERRKELPPMPVIVKSEPPKELSYKKLRQEKRLTIELKTEFDFDKSTIRPVYKEHLAKIAQFMKEHKDTVTTIEGHTCSIGTEEYNLKLSRRRALSVKARLVSLGVEAERLKIAAYGETKPIADNSTLEGRRRNRRAVAVITTTVVQEE